jgi:ABC-type antimicrobial peptide transport system ATPase subunit
MFEAKRLADSILLLIGGRMIEEGDAADVLERPKEDMTARFVRGENVYG